MEKILLNEINFDYDKEDYEFNKLFEFLSNTIGEGAFVKYRGDKPIGGLAPAYYEAITVGTLNALDQIHNVSREQIKQKIIDTVQTEEFRDNTGSGANRLYKLKRRIKVIQDALLELINE